MQDRGAAIFVQNAPGLVCCDVSGGWREVITTNLVWSGIGREREIVI